MSSLAKRAKPSKIDAKVAARTALRAAARANARFQAVDEDDEIEKLEEQLDELDYDSDLDTTEEYDIIKNRCTRLQVQCNRAAAADANKALTFTCAVCFDNCAIECLRIIAPCGHGFCVDCTDTVQALPASAVTCPTCRGPVASVIKPRF